MSCLVNNVDEFRGMEQGSVSSNDKGMRFGAWSRNPQRMRVSSSKGMRFRGWEEATTFAHASMPRPQQEQSKIIVNG